MTRVRSYSLAPSAVRSTLGGTATDDDVIRAMHIAAVDDVLPLMPDGLGEQVTEQGRSLSGGQQQRICLDRAILRNPDILILLEPASAVDAATSMVIAERLVTARQGRTTVVFSNSPFFHHLADRVFELPVTPDRTETNRG